MADILKTLATLIDSRGAEIDAWFAGQMKGQPMPFYSSVDLRHSGLKLVPVDTNLFPAGFNNLSQAALERATASINVYFSQHYPQAKRVLLVPENHTRNLGYLENVHTLQELLKAAGKEVRIGSLIAGSGQQLRLPTLLNHEVEEQALVRKNDALGTEDGFVADVVLVNNDLTAGVPDILKGLRQPVIPKLDYGWYQRRKSVHFAEYEKLVRGFADAFGVDGWLIAATFHRCGMVNFQERTGLECVALGVEKVLHTVRQKYEEYGIKETPYVFIKADSGTYGMGVMTARSGEELYEMNKKTRNKMNVIKEGAQNTEVIIQEGVPTVDAVEGKTAEPVMYLVNGVPVGGAYRVNQRRDAFTNLNATGMEFTGMCDESERDAHKIRTAQCNYKVFGLIARLASLAATQEKY